MINGIESLVEIRHFSDTFKSGTATQERRRCCDYHFNVCGRLLKRVFDIDIEHCPNCGGSLKIIAAIEDPPVIVKILSHLGLPTRAPPRAPARRFNLFQTI
jgi:hypothetical protein